MTPDTVKQYLANVSNGEAMHATPALVVLASDYAALRASVVEKDAIFRRCGFPPSTDADTTWCLALLQDGHITLSKAREWLGEYLREGIVGPLPKNTQELGPSIWAERDALKAQLADAVETLKSVADGNPFPRSTAIACLKRLGVTGDGKHE